jgi:phage baseplate assembly protein W
MSYNTTILNKKEDFWKDFDLTFSKNTEHNGLNTAGDINILYGKDAMSQSMKNILLTNNSERVFSMEFGTSIGKLLFENLNDKIYIRRILEGIKTTLQTLESRIDIIDISLEESDNDVNGGFEITLQYRTLTSNSNEIISTSISLYRVR